MPALRLTAHRAPRDRGFTLVEILVVVIIIGVLAAVAIPIFIGQQDQAKDAAVKSDLQNAKKALTSLDAANFSTYTTAQEALADFGLTSSSGTSGLRIMYGSDGESYYCIEQQSASGSYFSVTQRGTLAEGDCGTDFSSEAWAYDYDV